MPCESVMAEGGTVESKSNATRMRSPAVVFDLNDTENVCALLAELAAAWTNVILLVGGSSVTIMLAELLL